MNFDTIKSNCPKSWEDFSNYYKSEFAVNLVLKNIVFTDLPFELQLGVYVKYFQENGVELDICNIDFTQLPQLIEDTFQNYEKVISHYS